MIESLKRSCVVVIVVILAAFVLEYKLAEDETFVFM
jgi:hypothetical protein